MKNLFYIFLLLILGAKAEETITCFPSNDLRFYKNQKFLNTIDKEEFDFLIKKVEAAMSPIVSETLKKKLVFNSFWENATVDAATTRDEEFNPVINVYGGLARHPLISRDGFLLLLCHEVGHHLGGAPKSFRGKTTTRGWSSAEGEADYFAVTKCLPRIFNDGNDLKNSSLELETINLKNALLKCKDDVCARIILAGKKVSDVFASIRKSNALPEITNKDPSIVEQTYYMHPSPQCRLDTYIAGARCEMSIDILFDNFDPRIGACSSNSIGARPECWFKESEF